jgi:hypothetical protein
MIAALAISSFAYADAESDYYSIDSVEVTAVAPKLDVSLPFGDLSYSGAGAAALPLGGGGGVSPIQIINLGLQAWKLVQDNAPIADVASHSASALPQGATWTELTGWQAPASYGYHVIYRNRMNMTVIDFTYHVAYTAGGHYRGRGHYLAYVSAIVDQLTVAWGWKFEANVEVPTVLNAGTVAEPVASADLLLHMQAKSPLSNRYETRSYTVTGASSFAETTPSSRALAEQP